MDVIRSFFPEEWRWLGDVGLVVVAVLAGLSAHALLVVLVRRIGPRRTAERRHLILRHLTQPSRWLIVGIAVAAVGPALDLSRHGEAVRDQLLGLAAPALLGWLAIGGLRTVQALVEARADIGVADNLTARRKRTRAGILGRIGAVFIGFVSICLMLLSIPGIRAIGVTLMASAGIVGLVVGAAAQPALKNLIAGVQMAFTEPIRIDDVVVVGGEWGRIEEIRLTYVVVRLWDERRLVVPVSKFLEDSFQNWTRETSQLLGSVLWYLDPAADIDRLRGKLGEIVEADPRYDGRFHNLQVTDVSADAIEVRALVTARDASTSFDLRCAVREALLAHIRTAMPEALPRRRMDAAVTMPPPAHP